MISWSWRCKKVSETVRKSDGVHWRSQKELVGLHRLFSTEKYILTATLNFEIPLFISVVGLLGISVTFTYSNSVL